MNQTAQRIAVAEELGWVKRRLICEGEWAWIRPNGHIVGQCIMPDWLNCLNACHEMEKALDGYQWSSFMLELTRIVAREDCNGWVWHATARQRVEAFLRACGKWVE